MNAKKSRARANNFFLSGEFLRLPKRCYCSDYQYYFSLNLILHIIPDPVLFPKKFPPSSITSPL